MFILRFASGSSSGIRKSGRVTKLAKISNTLNYKSFRFLHVLREFVFLRQTNSEVSHQCRVAILKLWCFIGMSCCTVKFSLEILNCLWFMLRHSCDLRILHFIALRCKKCYLYQLTLLQRANRFSKGKRFRPRNLVDPASSHMLVSKIKPCMSQYQHYYR